MAKLEKYDFVLNNNEDKFINDNEKAVIGRVIKDETDKVLVLYLYRKGQLKYKAYLSGKLYEIIDDEGNNAKREKYSFTCGNEYMLSEDATTFIKDRHTLYGIEVSQFTNWAIDKLFSICGSNNKYDRARREIEKINNEMKIFKPVNVDSINRFIDKRFPMYLFYDNSKGKMYCTRCKKTSSYTVVSRFSDINKEKIIHNGKWICPSCRHKGVAKNLSLGRGKLQEIAWSVKVEKVNNNILFRYFKHTRDLSGNLEYEIKTSEEIRSIIFPDKTYKEYSNEYSYDTRKSYWSKYKEHYGHMGCQCSEYVRPRSIYLINTIDNLQKIIDGTEFKYSGLPEFTSNMVDNLSNRYIEQPYIVENYLYKYALDERVEKISKVNLTNLLFNNWGAWEKIPEGNTLEEIFNINRLSLKWLIHLGKKAHWSDVKILQAMQSLPEAFTEEDFKNFREANLDWSSLKKLSVYGMKVKTVCRYISKQDEKCSLLVDYLHLAEELGCNMKNKNVLYPQKLKQSYDNFKLEVQLRKDEAIRKNRNRCDRRLAKLKKELAANPSDPRVYKNDKFLIRPCYSLYELTKEGEQLNHCVSRYVDDVADGKKSIYFVRSIDAPTKSLYTVEYTDGQIPMVYNRKAGKEVPNFRGFDNEEPSKEAKAFVNDWLKLMA